MVMFLSGLMVYPTATCHTESVARVAVMSQYVEDAGGTAGKVLALAVGTMAGPSTVTLLALGVSLLPMFSSSVNSVAFLCKFGPTMGDASVRIAFPSEYHVLTQWNAATKLVFAGLVHAAPSFFDPRFLLPATVLHTMSQLGRALVIVFPSSPEWTMVWIMLETMAGHAVTFMVNRLQQSAASQAAKTSADKMD